MPCHTPDGVAPFPLETYEQVKNRSELVRFQSIAKTMPPTTATSDQGVFAHNAPLTDEEIITIQNWVRDGLPEGPTQFNAKSLLYEMEWAIGQPDLILKPTNPPQIQLEGPQYWQVFAIPLPDKPINLQAFDFIPVSKKSVRSATLALAPAGYKPPAEPQLTNGSMDIPGDNLIGVWAPGYPNWSLPQGQTRTLPPNGTLLVQVQYQPLGKPDSADFQLGLKAAPQAGKQGDWITLGQEEFKIPAGHSPTYTFTHTLDQPAKVSTIIPEARFYAAKMKVTATLPDGTQRTLFDTLQWDIYWAGNFQLTPQVSLPKGTVLTAEMSYSNDDKCVMNEGQEPKDIFSGPGIDQEVCRMHILLIPN